jgi:hypothetical protein
MIVKNICLLETSLSHYCINNDAVLLQLNVLSRLNLKNVGQFKLMFAFEKILATLEKNFSNFGRIS